MAAHSFSSTTVIVFIFLLSTVAHSATVGVNHLSRLLQFQDQERAPASDQLAAARGVRDRFIPSHSSSFDFQIISKY
jgi:alpha-N-acetylglucosaminidase